MADIHKRLEKAEKYLQKGKQEDALEEYLKVLEEDETQDAVRTTAADLCITLGRNSEAASLLSILFDRLASANDQAKAVVAFKKLARVGSPIAEQSLKFAGFIEKSDKKVAIEHYETAAKFFAASGKRNEELAAMRRITALEPSVANHKRLGELAEKMQDGKTACVCFLKAGDGEPENAARWYERAYSLDRDNAEAALKFGRVLVAAKDAKRAVEVAGASANAEGASDELREVLSQALILAGTLGEAEAQVLKLLQTRPERMEESALLLSAFLAGEKYHEAIDFAGKLDIAMQKRNARRDFVSLLKDVSSKQVPGVQFLEYLVQVYNSANREQDYCETLINLFQLYYAQGNFLKAADALDRCVEVDPYQSGNGQRLEMLRGKIEQPRYNAIAYRLQTVGATEATPEEKKAEEDEPTVLEDLMLQAEIFLQYSMRSKAVERLERIAKLFPREEDKNEKLRLLYNNSGFFPKYEAGPAPVANAATAAPMSMFGQAPTYGTPQKTSGVFTMQGGVPVPVNEENAVDNFSRVTEITRNIYRQSTVKGVLFTAVNDVGRHFNASRCVAALISPGKQPSAALEYCSPGAKQSDVQHLVKLLGGVQAVAIQAGTAVMEDAQQDPALAEVRPTLQALEIKSILGVPLTDAANDEQVGVLLLEQCEQPRAWRQQDAVVLKTIADQMVLAVNNAKLRSLMRNLAVTDEKSGLLKRSSYIDVLLSESKRALSQNSTMSVLLLQFGKAATMVKELGEAGVENMMQHVGQTVCSHIRQNDIAVRYDLTTIALILPDTTDKNAFFVVEKMRKNLAGFKAGGEKPLEMAVGIAEGVMLSRHDPVDIVTEVINRAESALDAARTEGANAAKSLAPQIAAGAVA